MQCPLCSIDTEHMEKGAVAFSVCPKCGGAWFGAPELERILGAAKQGAYAHTRLRDHGHDQTESWERDERHPRRLRHERSDSDDGDDHGSHRDGHGRRRGFLHNLMGMFD